MHKPHLPDQSAQVVKSLSNDELLALDGAHVWHPYSAVNSDAPLYAVESCSGVYIQLKDGRKLIDGMSSWWSTLHGYNHPELNQAVKEQLGSMAHVMFGGLTHEPAVRLAATLAALSPKGLTRVFYSDSGSVAVEVALKMALQYWQASKKPHKNRILSLRNGYHGDTFGAMSVCDPVTGMHQLFNGVLMEQIFTEAPQCGFSEDWNDRHIADFEQKLANHHQSLAAVILEPIVQGAGGMRFYAPEYLRQVRILCEQYHVLLIADEIATGFGRTGKLFACEHAQISPDILCLGKTLTGGYISLAATLCTDTIASTISDGEAGCFMHGPTYMGNPLACSVANKNIELLLASPWQERIATIEQQLNTALSPLSDVNGIQEVRCLGAIGVVELENPVDMSTIVPAFVEAGIWVRPFGKLVYIMPAFNITAHQLSALTEALCLVLKEYCQTHNAPT